MLSIIYIGYVSCCRWKKEYSGIPDAVSSIRANDTEYLTIIANSNTIKDKEAFARKIVHMYLDNSFHTIKFAERSKKLSICVYLHRRDMRTFQPVCQIEYWVLEHSDENKEEDGLDRGRLCLDGEKIEFY